MKSVWQISGRMPASTLSIWRKRFERLHFRMCWDELWYVRGSLVDAEGRAFGSSLELELNQGRLKVRSSNFIF